MISGAIAWLQANPLLATVLVYLATGVLNALFKPRTPEEYAAMPKWVAAALKFLSAVGFDPVKLVEALVTILKIAPPGDGSGVLPAKKPDEKNP
jgi:hypothetical protein